MSSVDDFVFDDDEDDLFASIADQVESERSGLSVVQQPELGRSDHSDGNGSGSGNDQQIFPGFDREAGTNWLYPVNYPIRNYQLAIVERALFANTLVVLPTGLGKTFVAAVVMFNIYRFYPKGKVVFMAPTKPLVAQQIEACFKVMGIPQDDMMEMTCAGAQGQPKNRRVSWESKRVFFLTPQLFVNDLQSGNCPAADVKCLVVDEAHKATGNHAYVMAVRLMSEHNLRFRVLALSATPGFSLDTVQEVITNLLISHVEIRADDSPELQPYINKRTVDVFVVPPGHVLLEFKNLFLDMLSGYLQRLKRHGVAIQRSPDSITKYFLIKLRDRFREEPLFLQAQTQVRGMIEGDFALCMTLYHGFELLNKQGLLSCYNFLRGIDEKNQFRIQNELSRNNTYQQLMGRLRAQTTTDRPGTSSTTIDGGEPSTAIGGNESTSAFSHPKMDKLVEVVVNHFETWERRRLAGSQSKINRDATSVMIFAEYRDTVEQIKKVLEHHRPLVRPLSFIGQSRGSAGATGPKGLTQKLQQQALDTFRRGNFNTLVSTCVAEEGLDIGEVDLIVCYEAHSSAVRLVQRMGRTGRKRDGRVVMLLTKGSEESIYKRSLTNKNSLHRAVSAKLADYQLYPLSPRMIPPDLNPVCLQVNVTELAFARKALTNRQRSANENSAFLSELELAEFRRRYELPGGAAAMRQPPTATPMLSLGGRPVTSFDTTSDVGHLSLTDWIPWQGSCQRTFLVSHSATTQMLVSGMNSSLMTFPDCVGSHHDAELVKSPIKNCRRRPASRGAPVTTSHPSIRNYFSPTKRLPGDAVAGPSTAPDYQPPTSPIKRLTVTAIQKNTSPAKRGAPIRKGVSLMAKRCHFDAVAATSTVDRFFRKQDKPNFFSLPDGCHHPRQVGASTSRFLRQNPDPLPCFQPPPDCSDAHLDSFLCWTSTVATRITAPPSCPVNFKLVLSDDSDVTSDRDEHLTGSVRPTRDSDTVSRKESHLIQVGNLFDSDETYCDSDLDEASPAVLAARPPESISHPLSEHSITAFNRLPSSTRSQLNECVTGIVALPSTDNLILSKVDGLGSSTLPNTKHFSMQSQSKVCQLSPGCPSPIGSVRPRTGGGTGLVRGIDKDAESGEVVRPKQVPLTGTGSNTKMTARRVADDSMLSMSAILELSSDNDEFAISERPSNTDSETKRLPVINSVAMNNLASSFSGAVTVPPVEVVTMSDHIPAPARPRSPKPRSAAPNRVKEKVRPLVSMKLISSSSNSSDSDGGIIYPSPVLNVRTARTTTLYLKRKDLIRPGVVDTNKTNQDVARNPVSSLAPISSTSARVGNAAVTTSTLGSSSFARINPKSSGIASSPSVCSPFAADSSVAASSASNTKMATSVAAVSTKMRSESRSKITTSVVARTSGGDGGCGGGGGGGGCGVDVDSLVPDYFKMTPPHRRFGATRPSVCSVTAAVPSRVSTPRANAGTTVDVSPPVTPVRRPPDRHVDRTAISSDDDDFVDPVTVRRRPDVHRRVRGRHRSAVAATSPAVSSPSPTFVRLPPKRRDMNANRALHKKFVLSQADISGEGHSPDANSDDDPALNAYVYDPSFIDDRVASTQLDNVSEGDITRYLRSIRSPPVRPGAFKLIPRHVRDHSSQESIVNVYSQQPQGSQLTESYEQDSFCVDNDEVEFVGSSDDSDSVRTASSCSPDVRRIVSTPIAPNRKRILQKFSSTDSDT